MKSFDETIQEILELADQQGTRDDGLLDEEVHADASQIASSVNNEGLEAQIKFLIEQRGLTEETVNYIKSLLTEE